MLGLNRRNHAYLFAYNPRAGYRVVDDKQATKSALGAAGVAVPALRDVCDAQWRVRGVMARLAAEREFVLKPARGAGGAGIVVVVDRRDERFVKASGAMLRARDLEAHACDVLAGTYSSGGRTDRLLVEELTGAAAPDFVYHIDIKPNPPGFTLSTENDTVEKTTNGTVAINVSSIRDRFEGPITLSVKGLAGYLVENAVMKQKKTNSMTLRILLPQSLPAAQVAVGYIQGEATIEDKNVFTRPWKISMPIYRHLEPNAQLMEFQCREMAEEN